MTYFTTREAADYLHFSYSHMRRLVAKGDAPSIKLGRSVRLTKESLDAWTSKKARVRETG
jgi:excisionase family DNA binding protein